MWTTVAQLLGSLHVDRDREARMPLDDYPRPAVTTDVVLFTLWDNVLHVLLIQRRQPPFEGCWCLPGGFVQIDETLEDAALRELEEETGVRDVSLEQLYTFGDVERDPRGRVITVAYLACVRSPAPQPRGGDDAAQARWWPIHDLPPLGFDHARIVDCALRRLRHKLKCDLASLGLVPERFTLDELQRLYEAILGEKLDAHSFRRRILQTKMIEYDGVCRMSGGRPVKLYRLREHIVAGTSVQAGSFPRTVEG